MALQTGTHLGPYEIVAQIGAGGMGEVYRATDTNLRRQVAIKVLPESLTADPDRLARFQREAEVLASLNHPNIAQIYGVEKSGNTLALVMELVDGPTLADRIAKGAIPLDEALPIAKQIAHALEGAHEQGIIHRDLKPANIKVRSDGAVKVLDFGLAKAMDRPPASTPGGPSARHALSMSPTLTSPAMMTGVGTILGTAAYMSPEQAKGRAADQRSDIWAFGAVLYELITGTRAFPGEDFSETFASVIKSDVDWRVLPPDTPAALERLLRRCLERDPKRRLHSIADARLEIEDASSGIDTSARKTSAPARSSRLAWGMASVLAAALAAAVFAYAQKTAGASTARRHLLVELPDDAQAFFAMSPDARSVVVKSPKGLTVRSLETGETRVLTGTDDARVPFWSPDSRTIGYWSNGNRSLSLVAASGGMPRVLCPDVGGIGGATWSTDGAILFDAQNRIMRAAASGAPCVPLAMGAGANRFPVFLPDGRHFLYTRGDSLGARTSDAADGIYVAALDRPDTAKPLLNDYSSALFVPDSAGSSSGRLLFVREQTLMAQRFDAAALSLSGEPGPLASRVTFQLNPYLIAASAARDGTLMYMTDTLSERQLVWYDRGGSGLARGAMVGAISAGVSLSADGQAVAFRRPDTQGQNSLWTQSLASAREARITAAPMAPGSAVWSPDGQRVVFGGRRGAEESGIYVKSVNGGPQQLLLRDNRTTPPAVGDWSRDGRWLFFSTTDPKTGSDVWLLPMTGESAAKPTPLLNTAALESQPQLSPDGKWLAYTSDEDGGLSQVYLRQFNGSASLGDAKWQVSDSKARGAGEPRWRADSKELYYLDTISGEEHILFAVPIGAGANPPGVPRRLFGFNGIGTTASFNVFLYAPSADGQRFLVDANATNTRKALHVILNWSAGWK